MTDSRQAVIFDLDGTLLDTLHDLATSGNEVLANRGFPPHPKEAYKTFIGDGMLNLVRRIFPENQGPGEGEPLLVALEEYRAAYSRNWKDRTRPFPGITDLLDQLQKASIAIGVLSNKAHDFTLKCVDEFLSDWKWDLVIGHREGAEKKPNPAGAIEAAEILGAAPENCFFVGDSDVDMRTAVNAGMHPVGVAWGFRSPDELRQSGAEKILSFPGELLDLLF